MVDGQTETIDRKYKGLGARNDSEGAKWDFSESFGVQTAIYPLKYYIKCFDTKHFKHILYQVTTKATILRKAYIS